MSITLEITLRANGHLILVISCSLLAISLIVTPLAIVLALGAKVTSHSL